MLFQGRRERERVEVIIRRGQPGNLRKWTLASLFFDEKRKQRLEKARARPTKDACLLRNFRNEEEKRMQ